MAFLKMDLPMPSSLRPRDNIDPSLVDPRTFLNDSPYTCTHMCMPLGRAMGHRWGWEAGTDGWTIQWAPTAMTLNSSQLAPLAFRCPVCSLCRMAMPR